VGHCGFAVRAQAVAAVLGRAGLTMSDRPSVYLAGPIKGLAYAGATSWREGAAARFADLGIDAFSPMRAKSYLKPLADVGGDTLKDAYAEYPLSTMKAILHRDYRDCTQCSAVLMYLLGAERVSLGSVMEVAWAFAARVPTVLVMEPGKVNVHEHGLLVEACGFRVTTLEEGIATVSAIILP
jgi:hypothetical protein